MTGLLPSPVHHVCMDKMGHYIIAEKASTNWQTTAFAGQLSDLIPTMAKLHNYFGPRGREAERGREVGPLCQWQRGVSKDGGGRDNHPDNHPPTHTDIARHMNLCAHYINAI